MIKVGQIYKQGNGEIFVITLTRGHDFHVVYNDGYVASYPIIGENNPFIFDELIAEYNTWQEAVNSKEFLE